MTDQIKEIIDRLEIRRMESPHYTARWCLSCLRTEIRNPFAMLHPGGDGSCKQQMQTGSLQECIAAFRSEQAELSAHSSGMGSEK